MNARIVLDDLQFEAKQMKDCKLDSIRGRHRPKDVTKRLASTQDKIWEWETQIEKGEPREMAKRK